MSLSLSLSLGRKSAAQWGQKWRNEHMDKNSTPIQIPVTNNNPLASSPQPSLPDNLFNKFKTFTEKIKTTLTSPSSAKTSTSLFDTFPPSLKRTVTLSDDGTEIFLGEISEEKWFSVIESYPVYVMEVEGSDPLFEQYLQERSLELRNRRLSFKKELSPESEMRSSFVAVNHQHSMEVTRESEGSSHQLNAKTFRHFSLVMGSETITDEEILLREEIQQIQQQVSLAPLTCHSPTSDPRH
jgi:hypothetical protein